MPALRMTEQQRREKALRVAVSRGKEERGYRHDMDVADAIGVNRSTYYRYRRESFQQMDLMHFAKLVKVLGLTGREVCSAFGVPYGGEEA